MRDPAPSHLTRHVFITGAYGYVGSVIRCRLEDAGWETTALVRRPAPHDRAIRWDLESPADNVDFASCTALVHCAYDFGARGRDHIWRTNVNGSEALLHAAQQAGVERILVISSMSAYPGTQQLYGLAKLAIESSTVAHGGVAIRLGLTYGDQPRGLVGTLLALMRLPAVPIIGRNSHQFPLHEDDLAVAVERILTAREWGSEVFGVAQRQPVAFQAFLRMLGAQHARSCHFLPVPWQLVYGALRAAELLRIRLPLRSDSVLGLVRPAPDVPESNVFRDALLGLRSIDPPTRSASAG